MAGLDAELASVRAVPKTETRDPVRAAPDDPAPGQPAGALAADRRAGLAGLARGGALGLLGSAVSAGSALVVVVAVTALLPATTAGQFFTVTSLFLIGQAVARLGTNTSLVYFVARMRALGEPERIAGCLRLAVRPVAAVGTLLGAAMFAVAPWVGEALFGPQAGSTAAALRILAVFLPVAAVADLVLAASRGFGTMRPTVVHDLIGRGVLQVVGVTVAVVAGWDTLPALAAAWVAPFLLPALAGTRDLRRLLPVGRPELPPGLPAAALSAREFWSFTWPRGIAGLAQIALQRLDIVLVAAFLGPAPAAVYTAATRVLVLGQLTNQALSSALQPRLGELLARRDREATTVAYRAATTWLILLNWPLYLLLAIFAAPLLGLLGPDYLAGQDVVLVLAAAMLLASACGMVNTVLIMAGRTSWNLLNAVLALGVNIVADLILIPKVGILGAGIGWALAIAVSNLTALGQIHRLEGIHPFGAATLRAIGLSALCFGVLPFGAQLLVDRPLVVAGALTLAGAAYVGLCHRWRRVLALDVLSRRRDPERA